MLFVFGLIVFIYLLGRLAGYSTARRFSLVVGLLAAVALSHLVLPIHNPLLIITGGTFAGWLIALGLALGGAGYLSILQRLKSAANAKSDENTPMDKPLFSNSELDRYARHIMLREIGGPGQKALKQAKVLVIGAGGLGAPALSYLGAMGVGTIGVIDDDVVENSNLQRQMIHTDGRIGMPKVFSAKEAIEAQNPHVDVRPYHRRLTEADAEDLFADYDVILDGTDNFETRYLANAAAAKAGKPLISGALSQWEGQLSVFDPANGTPCYQCVFPEAPAAGLAPSCAEAGVSAALPGVIGSMMAQEAMKLITGAGQSLKGEMFFYDSLYADTRKIKLRKREDCPVCHAL
ncbi:MAG: HesA/MoeB/ThiF family protein [Paracoccaceae bacterium]|nr:HesA/MoeB/ThiF family protein [Paracoccaceae bacterium]MDG1737566.1 HesA/MoeB/ThiF family protein [Paracoccaceae bacterium]MDG2257494.1 HesA/MoeB/ThiF family protein [Paracoccaceae bacterium]